MSCLRIRTLRDKTCQAKPHGLDIFKISNETPHRFYMSAPSLVVLLPFAQAF